jgi:hypothetical protein
MMKDMQKPMMKKFKGLVWGSMCWRLISYKIYMIREILFNSNELCYIML